MTESIDEIRKKKLEEYMRMSQQKQSEEQEFQQQVQQLEAVVKQRMTKDALQRYGNIKAANPERAMQLLAILGQFIQSGRIEQVEDELLKKILAKLSEGKKDFQIRK